MDTASSVQAARESSEDEIDAFLSDGNSLNSLILDDGPPVIRPRPYQKEMLEESLKRNIIVAMDTGSGKTHIAVMRMLLELERIPSNQIIWFLAPTVALCAQQHDVIKAQITAVQTKFLSGADGVERWTEQAHWDAVLKNIRVVVSTHQILLDALSHGFVQMESLALIVFDEAHNCVRDHPGAKVMSSFYHPRKQSGLSVPAILGLTASPVMRSDPKSLANIEATLDAICRTPTKHRAELRLQVKLPILLQIQYQTLSGERSQALSDLAKAVASLKFTEDPYYISLLKDNSEKGRRKLDKVRMSRKTWASDQMRTFHRTGAKIYEELGSWAADYYVSQVGRQIKKAAGGAKSHMDAWDVTGAEKRYLAKALESVGEGPSGTAESVSGISDKVKQALQVLVGEETGFSGIVFVQERALAAVLAHLISVHPITRGRFNIGTIVGTSAHSLRPRNICDLIDLDEQKYVLSKFKSGKINLAIATSVLEEGIDVPSCNLVLCFQKPANIKSFVQRRGRARHRDSKLVLLIDSADAKSANWEQLESDMRKAYEDEMRTLAEFLEPEDTEEHDGRFFRVQSTNALLDLDNATSHLYHFCAKLPATAYVDRRPEFICLPGDGDFVRAKVILPLSVDESVRVAESLTAWKSEKNAMKDAAFQAYVALYQAGLVNDNLLPNMTYDAVFADLMTITNTQASLVKVNERLNPWVEVARGLEGGQMFQSIITFQGQQIAVLLPCPLLPVPDFILYWDATTDIVISIAPSTETTFDVGRATEETWAMLQAAFGSRFLIEKKPSIILFATDHQTPLANLLGKQDVSDTMSESQLTGGLIRDKLDPNPAYTFCELLTSKPDIHLIQHAYNGYEAEPDSLHLSIMKLPRRSDFLHKLLLPANHTPSSKPYSAVLPLSRCTVDDMPFRYYQFGRLIPSITHHFEKYLLAAQLSSTILRNVGITNLDLIVPAISASSTNEANYQRLEFLGDTVLKTCTSIQLMAEHPLWHEGYLTEIKGRIVSNASLYTAAITAGLDKFIITKAFNGHKWRPQYVDDLVQLPVSDGQRELSSKIPADVVEALIGVSVLDGGISKALLCLQTFLPRITWQPFEVNREFLFNRTPNIPLPPTLQPLEELLGYTFQNKGLLVEATTHASCPTGSASLERLEFLGDAILDHLVVAELWKHNLSHVKMHLFRTALVNADILAFLCMESCVEQEVVNVSTTVTPRHAPANITAETEKIKMPLWRFMRHASPHVASDQALTSKRHAALAPQIRAAFSPSSNTYPWALLARLQAQKFYSDLVEAVIGAVWVDSGSWEVVGTVLGKLGVWTVLGWVLGEGRRVLNPKEELGILADSSTVSYVVSSIAPTLSCRILVGDREVVVVDQGVSKVEVETRAAEQAVQILGTEKGQGRLEEQKWVGMFGREWWMGIRKEEEWS